VNKIVRVIDFDVAQALVNYVVRQNQSGDLNRPNFNATTIRIKLVELRDINNNVSVIVLNQWLTENQDPRMGVSHKIPHLKDLIKKASFSKKVDGRAF